MPRRRSRSPDREGGGDEGSRGIRLSSWRSRGIKTWTQIITPSADQAGQRTSKTNSQRSPELPSRSGRLTAKSPTRASGYQATNPRSAIDGNGVLSEQSLEHEPGDEPERVAHAGGREERPDAAALAIESGDPRRGNAQKSSRQRGNAGRKVDQRGLVGSVADVQKQPRSGQQAVGRQCQADGIGAANTGLGKGGVEPSGRAGRVRTLGWAVFRESPNRTVGRCPSRRRYRQEWGCRRAGFAPEWPLERSVAACRPRVR